MTKICGVLQLAGQIHVGFIIYEKQGLVGEHKKKGEGELFICN